MEWYIYVLKKYAVFSGRAQRREYWEFILVNLFIALLFFFLSIFPTIGKPFSIVSICYSIALFVPTLAVTVRRLHDIRRSGFSLFLIFIPLIGIIIFLTFMAKNGTSDENEYGPNQKREVVTGKNKMLLLILFLIVLIIFLMVSISYLGFQTIRSKEIFGVYNVSNNTYYLNVVFNKGSSQPNSRKYEQVDIDSVKYTYICKTGRYKLGNKVIFHCEKNEDVDVYIKLKNIFDELKITDENDKVIWDINDGNLEDVLRAEDTSFTQSIFWTLQIR